MKWTQPHFIKFYEALGAIADGRVEVDPNDHNKAKIYSSNRDKFYEVSYDPENNAIMANDNAAYWKGTLGYTAIAYLLITEVLPLNTSFVGILLGIAWKNVNTKNKNDYDKTIAEVDEMLAQKGVDMDEFRNYLRDLERRVQEAGYIHLGKKKLPPKSH